MPQIPRASDIDIRVPSGQQAIYREDTRLAGAGLQIAADTVNAVRDSRSEYQLSQANAEFLKAKIQQDNAYEGDREYSTIPTRYENTMRKALEESSRIIEDPRARRLFEDKASVSMFQGYEDIRNYARGVEEEVERGRISNNVRDLIDGARPGNVEEIRSGIEALLQSGYDQGYMDLGTMEQLKDESRDDVFAAVVSQLDPEEMLQILNDPIFKDVPPRVTEPLRREGEALDLERRAYGVVDNLRMKFDNDPVRLRQELNLIENSALRTAANELYNRDVRADATTETLTQNSNLDKFIPLVRHPDDNVRMTAEDLYAHPDFANLGNEVQRMLLNEAEQASKGYTIKTDPSVMLKLFDMKVVAEETGDYLPIRQYYGENVGRLSESDREQWAEVAAMTFANTSPEVKQSLTDLQYVTNRIQEFSRGTSPPPLAGTTRRGQEDDRLRRAMQEWNEFSAEYQMNNAGRTPPLAEKKKFVDDLLIERTYRDGTTFFGNPRMIEGASVIDMDSEDMIGFIREETTASPDLNDSFLQAVVTYGIATEEDLVAGPEIVEEKMRQASWKQLYDMREMMYAVTEAIND